MRQDLIHYQRVFNAGNDLHGTAALLTGLDVDPENTLQALSPAHGLTLLRPGSLLVGRSSLTASGRGDLRAPATVRGKYPMEAGEIDSWPGYQRRQSGNEIQWFEDDVGGAVAVRRFQRITDIALTC